jgi:multiple sugar transport system permease protein
VSQLRIKRVTFGTIVLNLVLWAAALIMIFPLLWLITTSLKLPQEVLSWPPQILPRNPVISNYIKVFQTIPIFRYFLNSFGLATVATIAILFTSSLAGFVFAKYHFPGREIIFMIFLATMVVPFETYMVPLFLYISKLGWLDTYQGILMPWLVMSFGVFLMRQTISTLPDEIMDAARIDGASEWKIYWRVILPVFSSTLSSLAIFSFTYVWAEFIWPLMVINSRDKFTLELGLSVFQQRYTVEYGLMTAAASIIVLPVIIVFVVLRRRLVEAITIQGLKG